MKACKIETEKSVGKKMENFKKAYENEMSRHALALQTIQADITALAELVRKQQNVKLVENEFEVKLDGAMDAVKNGEIEK